MIFSPAPEDIPTGDSLALHAPKQSARRALLRYQLGSLFGVWGDDPEDRLEGKDKHQRNT
jgi:hypothetical protein